jgi:cation diffusion facilitator CzcD-associated flavoprotein CzcO
VPRDTDVIVIGAGPAGLATSRALQRTAVAHVVLERGARAGTTWAGLYDSLVLHTARALSALPDSPLPRGTPLFPSRHLFATYLEQYVSDWRLPVETNIDVARAIPDAGGWTVETAAALRLRSRALVVATGIVANPWVPDLVGRERFGGRLIHSVEYKRPASVVGRRVVVVGAGNSAGEIAVELARAGLDVALAVRTGNAVVPREVLGVPLQYLALGLAGLPRPAQRVATRLVAAISTASRGPSGLPPPGRKVCSLVPLIGRHVAEFVQSGRIRVRPGLAELTEEGVRFADGSVERADTVILATGYRPALGIVRSAIRVDDCGFARRMRGVASADQPNLYFVGHTYDLRGAIFNMRREARQVATLVSASR